MPMALIQITPEKYIEFPCTRLANGSTSVVLKNVSGSTVAYKVKTTAPKNYLVRPSYGSIVPAGSQEVAIALQPQNSTAGDLTTSSSHRFLIQATEVGMDQQVNKEFWTTVPKGLIQEQRLSVLFKGDEESGPQVEAATGAPVPFGTVSTSVTGIAPPPTTTTTSAAGVPGVVVEIPRRAGPPPIVGDVETKYNDLVQYCLGLEKERNNLKKELEPMRLQVENLLARVNHATCGICGGKTAAAGASTDTAGGVLPRSRGYELWQVIALLVIVVVVLKVFDLL